MVSQYENNLLCSLYMWAGWKIGQYAQAYATTTTPLYYQSDPALPPGLVAYASPFKSWIYDSGISGAYIIQQVSGGGFSAPLDRSSGVHFDYVNGRVIMPSSYGTNLSLTGTLSLATVNLYQPNDTEEAILTQGAFYLNPYFNGQATGAIPPYSYVTPAVFINTLHQTTNAYQFGGLIDCTTTFSFVLYMQTNFQLQALLSIFRDTKYQYIPMLNTINYPLDGYGDTKGGTGYNYLNIINTWGQPGNLIYIKDVHTSKVSDRVKMSPSYFVGLVDMDVSYIRQAPIGTNIFT